MTFDPDLYFQGCLAVMLPISWIILMWHKYNPWRDNVSHIVSQSIDQRSRSHRPFDFLQSSILLDYWSTISSYCWRKEGFRPSMNVSWDFCRWHCWGIHCWSCIYCLNVPCYKRYDLTFFIIKSVTNIPSIHTNFNWKNIYFPVVLYHLFQNNNV